jgi:hypothetical protein
VVVVGGVILVGGAGMVMLQMWVDYH